MGEKLSTAGSSPVPKVGLSHRILSEADDCADLVFSFNPLLFNEKMWRTFWWFVISARAAGVTGIEILWRSPSQNRPPAFLCLGSKKPVLRSFLEAVTRQRQLGFTPSRSTQLRCGRPFSAGRLNWRAAAQLPRSGRSSLLRHFTSCNAFDVGLDHCPMWIFTDRCRRIDAIEGWSQYQSGRPCSALCSRGRQSVMPDPIAPNSCRAIASITRSAISVSSARSPNEKTRGLISNTQSAPSRISVR